MADPVLAKTIETTTHGRYLVRPPAAPGPWPLLVGFHGYKENARTHLDVLTSVPGAERWLVVAVQGLHRFYTQQTTVVASWMTREDRELAIADNVAYVGRVLDAVRQEHATRAPLVFAGFSQGVAMAFRAAAHYHAEGLIALATDVPPDVRTTHWAAKPRVLLGRGTRDEWYTEQKQAADIEALRALGIAAETCVFDAGHEWSPAFSEAAGRLLSELR